MKDYDKKQRVISKIKSTLDILPFSTFHFKILYSLGISWIIDGYEVSLLSILSGILKVHLHMDDVGVAQSGSMYLLGCVFGALIFAYLSQIHGRKKLFSATLIIYITSIVLTATSFSRLSFYICRFLTGVAIGGEYTAIFAAVDELIPTKYRGASNIIIDGTFHIGSIIACILSYLLLGLYKHVPDNKFKDVKELNMDVEIIWRALFLIGAIMAIPVLFMRKHIPESPRWLILKGYGRKAIEELNNIKNMLKEGEVLIEENIPILDNSIDETNISFSKSIIDENKEDKIMFILKILFVKYPTRFLYALSLMIAQAFFYNGIYYTFGLVLENYYNIDKEDFGLFLIPLSISNFLGPVCLGRYFDSWSRRKMISLCYLLSGLLLIMSGIFFIYEYLNIYHQIFLWGLIFFIASPGASAAHLTVSEIFPTDIRSEALAIFFSIGILIGGVVSPVIFSTLIDNKNRLSFGFSYFISAGLMMIAGIINYIFGVDSEKKSLEEIANIET